MTPGTTQTLSFGELRLRVGERLQLDPPQRTGLARLPVRIVGWVDGQSLITTLPRAPTGRLELGEGEIVLLRAFAGTWAFAFRCSVLKRASPPFEYLHLSYPENIEAVAVRSSPRCKLGLPARVKAAGGMLEARIEDIGVTGARLSAPQPLGEPGARIELSFDLVLHQVPVSLTLAAEIRSGRLEEERHNHGVSFVEPKPNDSLVLASLLCFNMQVNPHLSV